MKVLLPRIPSKAVINRNAASASPAFIRLGWLVYFHLLTWGPTLDSRFATIVGIHDLTTHHRDLKYVMRMRTGVSPNILHHTMYHVAPREELQNGRFVEGPAK